MSCAIREAMKKREVRETRAVMNKTLSKLIDIESHIINGLGIIIEHQETMIELLREMKNHG